MFFVLGIGFLCGFITAMLLPREKQSLPPSPIDKLKNALLTVAILITKQDDMDHNFNYATYDGTKFPPLSGSSIPHACFSYILNRDEFRQHAFYTNAMESKLDAIEKYLANNFSTDDHVMDFFGNFFMKCITPVIEAENKIDSS
jgi:hypothetical protein